MEKVIFQDLGLTDYQRAWNYQQSLLEELVARKRENRRREREGMPALSQRHYLLFCEHPPVYTLGKSGAMNHLLLDEAGLQAAGFRFYKINRGGDITYHGPGQIVGYPIFDLDCFFTDAHRYVRHLEEAVIRTLAKYDLAADRLAGYTGVWLPPDEQRPYRKICAIGVHLSRWVTMHGFAFNVRPDLSHFRHIVPCGIDQADKSVTSLEIELGAPVSFEEVKATLLDELGALFGFEVARETTMDKNQRT
jgi:lipoyl(octanoyl) transferase